MARLNGQRLDSARAVCLLRRTAHHGQEILSEDQWAMVRSSYRLTARELDCVRTLFDTGHRPYIAAVLGVSVHTVDTHLSRAYVKVGVEDRGDLILAVIDHVAPT